MCPRNTSISIIRMSLLQQVKGEKVCNFLMILSKGVVQTDYLGCRQNSEMAQRRQGPLLSGQTTGMMRRTAVAGTRVGAAAVMRN